MYCTRSTCVEVVARTGKPRNPHRRNRGRPCIAFLAFLLGCQAPADDSSRRVGEAWRNAPEGSPPAARSDVSSEGTPPAGPTPARGAAIEDSIIATVNGAPVRRGPLVDLLLAGHGPGMLEQIVVLEAARRVAADRGITISQADIEREYQRSLRQLAASVTGREPDTFNQQAGETILAAILVRRNISQREYRQAMERNAYLRKIVTAELRITPDQLRREYERVASNRVSIRHIELKDPGQVAQVRRLLDAGVPFPDLARLYSTNTTTGQNGGALEPFTADDPDVPALLREVAFALKDGEASNAVRIENAYHLVHRQGLLPGRTDSFETLRPELEQRLRDRLTPPAMQLLYRELYDGADITIYDPVLRDAVERREETVPSSPQADWP